MPILSIAINTKSKTLSTTSPTEFPTTGRTKSTHPVPRRTSSRLGSKVTKADLRSVSQRVGTQILPTQTWCYWLSPVRLVLSLLALLGPVHAAFTWHASAVPRGASAWLCSHVYHSGKYGWRFRIEGGAVEACATVLVIKDILIGEMWMELVVSTTAWLSVKVNSQYQEHLRCQQGNMVQGLHFRQKYTRIGLLRCLVSGQKLARSRASGDSELMAILISSRTLDEEVAFIYPAPWNIVKVAYLICRYYPLAIAPFHLWGVVGDHEQRVYVVCTMKRKVLAVLSVAFFGLIGVIVWVMSKELTLSQSLVFVFAKRSGCFAISDHPASSVAQTTSAVQGIVTTFFDCLNMFVVVWHCVRRGMMVYVAMTALNALTIGTFLSSDLIHQGLGSSSSLAYILPSILSCRLVLMLRRKASPTETELRVEHSYMVNEALERIAVEQHPEEISLAEGFRSSVSTDAQAQP
ncbi:hypothetical protein BJY52DRAFT_1402239 [Lactarius psammicola]|nr:hypothetical protein BJY52DRAFT_1402239 [Lactarius psammicola]